MMDCYILFLDGDDSCFPSYDVYISLLICFVRVCSKLNKFNNKDKFLTAKLLKQGYQYHKQHKALSKIYHRHSGFILI